MAKRSDGNYYGNYVACHLAVAIMHFTFVEWDEAQTPGLDGSAYKIVVGLVHFPALPGFGLCLDTATFNAAVEQNGGSMWL